MNDEIIKLREELVGLSSDPIKTRELLDKLTEEEIFQHDIESTVHVGKNEIEEEKDFEFYKVCKTRNGYLIHYKGGYTVVVDEKNISCVGALETLLENDGGEDLELAKSAIEIIFRLPLFVFSQPAITFNIATIATQYLLYLQKTGEVPTPEMDNPEFDKCLMKINEFMDDFIVALEKEGKEYERRNGTNVEKEVKTESEGESEGSDKQAES